MLAVVEHHLEHPVGVGDLGVDLRLVKEARAAPDVVEQRRAVAVVDALQVAVGGAASVVLRTAVALVGIDEVDALPVFRLVA